MAAAATRNPFVSVLRTPVSGYRPVPARLTPTRVIVRGPQLHPGGRNLVDAVRSAFTPDRFKDQPPPTRPRDVSFVAGLKDVAHSLDPRTTEGLVNWGAMFIPGPGGRGGRFAGKLTSEQEHFMLQLNNIIDELGDTAATQRYWENVAPLPYRQSQKQVEADPNLGVMADVFGYTRGHRPLGELAQNTPGNIRQRQATFGLTEGSPVSPGRIESREKTGELSTLLSNQVLANRAAQYFRGVRVTDPRFMAKVISDIQQGNLGSAVNEITAKIGGYEAGGKQAHANIMRELLDQLNASIRLRENMTFWYGRPGPKQN